MSTTGMNKNKEWNRQVIKKFIYREKGGRKTNSGTGNSSKKLYMKAKEEKKEKKEEKETEKTESEVSV